MCSAFARAANEMEGTPMDWFETLAGFRESTGDDGYRETQRRFAVDGEYLTSSANGRRWRIGRLELASLDELRQRVAAEPGSRGPSTVRLAQGDVGKLHASPANAGALFQVASQFNLLEMMDSGVTPEDGVTGYVRDHTQGPACAMAAGAATIYRNYFAPVGGAAGQTEDRQLDGFAEFGGAIAEGLDRSAGSLWTMQNGYALFRRGAVDAMSSYVASLDDAGRDAIRRRLRIGLHWDVEVTRADAPAGQIVSQAFCSALPVAYDRESGASRAAWVPLATLVLEAAYEATLLAAVHNARRGASSTVMLTFLGGGAFGNEAAWIEAAIERAVSLVRGQGLDIVLVSYAAPASGRVRWVERLRRAASRPL